MCRRLFALAVGFGLLALTAPRAVAADSALEGTIWTVKDLQGQPDTLTFKSGKFESSVCTPYGYKASPYREKAAGAATKWSATCKNDSKDVIHWTGNYNPKTDEMTGTFARTTGKGEKLAPVKWTATRKKAA